MDDLKPDIIQNIPLKLTAILIAQVSGSADTQNIIEACGIALLGALRSVKFIASIQAINVEEVHIPMASGRTQ